MTLAELSLELERYQVTDIMLDGMQQTVRIGFVRDSGDDYLVIEANGLAFYRVAKDPLDDEGCFVIGRGEIRTLDQAARQGLANELQGRSVLSEHAKYHVHIEGDLSLDIVCRTLYLLRGSKV